MCLRTAESSPGPGHLQIVPSTTLWRVSENLVISLLALCILFLIHSYDGACFVWLAPLRLAGSVAQMVERSLRMRQVQGSMPCTSKDSPWLGPATRNNGCVNTRAERREENMMEAPGSPMFFRGRASLRVGTARETNFTLALPCAGVPR